MKGTFRGRTISPLFVGVALLLMTASAVWACTPQPRIFSLGPQVGPVGLEITVEGQTARGAQVEARWNSFEGAVIGQGTADFNGNFAVKGRVPQAEPGVYFVVVAAGDAGVVRMPFEVTSERAIRPPERVRTGDPAASSADLWSAFSGNPAGAGQGSGVSSAVDTGSGTQALLGGALLLAGFVALGSGLFLARRKTAGARNSQS